MTDRALMTLPVFLPRGGHGTGRIWLRYHHTRWFMIPSRLSALAMIIERLQSLKSQIEAPDQDQGPDTMKIVTEDIRQRTVSRGVWGWTRLGLVALGGLVVLNVSGRILRGPFQFCFLVAVMVVWFKVVVPRLQPKRRERSTVGDDTRTPRAHLHPRGGTDALGEAER